MKKILYIIIITTVFFATSCEKLMMERQPGTSPTEIFEQVWTFADQNYSFFDYKHIDWDSVKLEYEQKIDDNMSEEALFDTLANMLYLLKDGHVNLKSPFNRSRNWSWFLDYPENYDYSLLERNYFNSNEQYLNSFVVYDFGDVGYISYKSFMTMISSSDMDYVIEKFKDYKGVIIDIRGNGGGALFNVYTIANRFVTKKIETAYEIMKSGPGHDDFGERTTYSIEPVSDTNSFTIPIVILTNRSCFSASTFFTTIVKSLPNVTVIGDTTGGGGGIPTYTELSNGWTVRVSTSILYTKDGFNVENGIAPDIAVNQTDIDTQNGKDSILEYALAYLRSK